MRGRIERESHVRSIAGDVTLDLVLECGPNRDLVWSWREHPCTAGYKCSSESDIANLNRGR